MTPNPPPEAPFPGSVRRRIGLLGLFLVAGNVAAWAWAWMLFAERPALLSTALLAYVFGLRHAVDPDHIAAIDNVTRKLLQAGQRPVSVGLWFALGHSTVVVAAAAALALAATSLLSAPPEFRELGTLIGTGVSAGFLIVIGLVNLVVLVGIWRGFREFRRTGRATATDLDGLLSGQGLLARLLRPLFRLITRPWHMYPLGFLFALGFDTATEVSLFGLSAAEASKGTDPWAILVFPALFTAGMALVDALDGVLMLGAYSWATVQPMRRLFYNLTITSLSVVVALGIGTLEALNLLADRLSLQGAFWGWIGALNDSFGLLGFGIVGLFAGAWGLSFLVYRLGGFDRAAAIPADPR
ncbi:HoxN/HupN/NixA family nickel/cobalt transporter [Methylobacterium aerolatum]|uniref:Nickel/cobalt efflux system n=1 Tax=Methylobacterium aerolatum TaxID=418708 RepID=A0ABU0I385_9HYPH|nr:HoxN/HupN/NixA family nickel/cobalt transporter [Methylobacterium aerolatum]MDQ0448139.1 high-affinity nickel-transport protein [Methylobacterium aerolatum]GJD33994.1 High-affinity nickel transport protein [Methylobacterium aerolatum]